MMRFPVYSLFLCLLASAAHAGPGPTRVRAHRSLMAEPRCPALIQATTNAIQAFDCRNGVARLGYADVLEQLIAEASTPQNGKTAVEGLEKVKAVADSFPATRYAHWFLKGLLREKMLAICILPPNSTLGQVAANHCAFAGRGEEAVMLTPVPLPGSDGIEWASSFFSTVGMVAGERFVMDWAKHSYSMRNLSGGRSIDPYYDLFVSAHYRGQYPPPRGTVKQGFARVVMQMFQAMVALELSAHFFPDQVEEDNRRFGETDYALLTRGPNSRETKAIVEQLEINADNYARKAEEMIYKMNEAARNQIESN
ncbi:MAG: hypothetical protein R3B54_07565 [Bdellovibrionota bacterium]